MLISHLLFVEIYSRLTSASIAGLWQGAALSLFAAVLLRLMPRVCASLRHMLLVAVFMIAAVLPWLHFGTSRAQTATGHTLQIAPWIAGIIALTWVILSCVRATALFLAWRRLRIVHEHAIPVALEGIVGFEAGERRALLCVSSDVDSPTIIGFLHPRMLLPAWMVPLLAQDDLRQIALHECEHLRRYDDWLNLLLQVGLVLSPLNPALVWLDRRIDIQRELACDAAVVRATSQPIAYATCLTRLAEQRMQHARLALAMAAWGKQSELGQRVQALLAQSATWTQRQSRLATSASVAVLFAGAIGLARSPQFVRVAEAPQAASMSAALTRIDAARGSRVSFDDRMPAGVRALPASFLLKPTTVPLSVKHAKRKPLLERRSTLVPLQNWPDQPRMVRTSAVETNQPHRRTGDFRTDYDQTSVRFVTTKFSSPYLAVPVANGWLVFQL